MIDILSRTISAVVDQKMVLHNDVFARTLSIGSSWGTVRIGMRLALNVNSFDGVLFIPKFYFGLSSGTTSVAGDQSATNFFGLGWNQTISFSPSGGVTGQNGGNGLCAVKIVSGTETQGTPFATLGLSSSPTTLRTIFILEITKGNPNFTLSLYHPTLIGAGTDQSYATLLTAMETSTASLNSLLANHSVDTTTLAFSESGGALDSINLHWSYVSRSMEISEIVHALVPDLSAETFESYTAGPVADGSLLTGGINWAAGAPVLELPYIAAEDFESYANGSAGNGSTLTGGANWTGSPTIS